MDRAVIFPSTRFTLGARRLARKRVALWAGAGYLGRGIGRVIYWWISLMALAAALQGAAEITRAETVYRSTESFVRIAEYLTGEPSEGPELVARTQPQDRTGLYFRVVLTAPVEALPGLASAEISVLGVESPEPMNYRLSLAPGGVRSSVLLLGLTGEDWPDDPGAPHPTAWRVRLLDGTGAVLAEHRSFLWGTR